MKDHTQNPIKPNHFVETTTALIMLFLATGDVTTITRDQTPKEHACSFGVEMFAGINVAGLVHTGAKITKYSSVDPYHLSSF